MGKNTHKAITILDPDRWGLRYGNKRQWYYKIRLDFFSDPLIQALDNNTKIVFLLIINESLRVNSESVSMCLEYCKGILSVPLGICKHSVMTLKRNNIISLETNLRNQLIEENRIEKNITNAIKKIAVNFDLDAIYQAYPRKQGKKAGIDKLSKIITSDDIYQKILHGAERYANYHDMMKTDKKYIKQFSAWVNQECWEDELDTSHHKKIILPSDLEENNV